MVVETFPAKMCSDEFFLKHALQSTTCHNTHTNRISLTLQCGSWLGLWVSGLRFCTKRPSIIKIAGIHTAYLNEVGISRSFSFSRPWRKFWSRFSSSEPLSNSAIMSTLAVHCHWEGETDWEKNGRPLSYADAKKVKPLALNTHGYLRVSLKLR